MSDPQNGKGKKGAGGHAAKAITRQRRLETRRGRRDSRTDLKTLAENGGHTQSSSELDALPEKPPTARTNSGDDQDGCF